MSARLNIKYTAVFWVAILLVVLPGCSARQTYKTPDLCIITEMRNNSSISRIVAYKETHRKDRTDEKNRTVTNIRLEICIAERIEVVKLLNDGVAVELYNVVLDSVPMYPNAKGIYYDGLRKLTKSTYRMSYDNTIRLNGVVLSVVEFIGKMQEMGVEITKEKGAAPNADRVRPPKSSSRKGPERVTRKDQAA